MSNDHFRANITDPDHVPWGLRPTLIGLVLALAPGIIISLALQFGLNLIIPIPPGISMIAAFLTQGIFIIVPIFFARRSLSHILNHHPTLRETFSILGLRPARSRPFLVVIICILILLLCFFSYTFLAQHFNLPLQTSDQNYITLGERNPSIVFILLVLAVFVAPFCEELFFQGFIYPGLRNRLPNAFAILLSALFFALAYADLSSFPILMAIGLVLSALRWYTRSVYPGMFLHMLNNAFDILGVLIMIHIAAS